MLKQTPFKNTGKGIERAGFKNTGNSLKKTWLKPKPKKKKTNYTSFFNKMIIEMQTQGAICQNCGNRIDLYIPQAAICHILPKEKYKSVAELPENIVYMCIDCHHEFDNTGVVKRQKMKIYPFATMRVQTFKDLVLENGRLLQEYLNFEINTKNN